MINKTLVHCNFGNMCIRPEIEGRCMKSWEKYFPKSEWNWVELNESTYDVNKNFYTKIAYNNRQYSLVSDYARVDYLYHHGGVYVDMDYLALKSLTDDILINKSFFSIATDRPFDKHMNFLDNRGFPIMSWGIVGTEKNNELFNNMLNSFNKITNINDITYNNLVEKIAANKALLTLENFDLSNITEIKKYKDCTVYPFDYFTCNLSNINKIKNSKNSYGVHLYANSWHPFLRIVLHEKIIEKIKDL